MAKRKTFEKFAINFVDPTNEKLLCAYDSFISVDELSETCDLLMAEKSLDSVRIDIVENGEVKLQYLKQQDEKLKKIE